MSKKKFPGWALTEYIFFQFMKMVVSALPVNQALTLGRFMGDLFYLLDGKHRKQARRNIELALNLPQGRPQNLRTARASFRNLGQVAVEFILLSRVFSNDAGGRALLDLSGAEKVEEALSHGRGLVFVTGHTGNWELMGSYVSRYLVPLWSIARPFRNLRLERFIRERRERYRQKIIPKQGALLKSARILKEGGVVAFLMDQHAGSSEPKLDFLGVPAHTFSTPGALAVRFKAPVMAGFCYRTGKDFRYKGYFEDPLYPVEDRDPSKEVLRITQGANEAIGRFIRAHPAQWLWMHRRWR